MLVDDDVASLVKTRADTNRANGIDTYPRYVAAVDFYFGKEGISSIDCLRWRDRDGTLDPQCLPVGGQSVWGVLGGPSSSADKPVVMATAGMDSTGLFHDAAYGGCHQPTTPPAQYPIALPPQHTAAPTPPPRPSQKAPWMLLLPSRPSSRRLTPCLEQAPVVWRRGRN